MALPFLKPVGYIGSAVVNGLKFAGKRVGSAIGKGFGILKNAAGSIYRNAKSVAIAGVKALKLSYDLRGLPKAQRGLVKELINKGTNIKPKDVLGARRLSNGKIVFLEKGNPKAGLEHILKHANDFANKGISTAEIPDYVLDAVQHGKIVGYQGRGNGRAIYERVIGGTTHRTAITVGNNGFIVGANPKGRKY